MVEVTLEIIIATAMAAIISIIMKAKSPAHTDFCLGNPTLHQAPSVSNPGMDSSLESPLRSLV
jgi:hypothetical protein